MLDNSEKHFIEDINHTFSNTINGISYFSIIDHFIGNQRIYDAVLEARVIDNPNNHSGHLPIFTKFNVCKLNIEVEELERIPKPSWDKANHREREHFQLSLQQLLSNITPPDQCDNCNSLKCEINNDDIDIYATSVCEALDKAAHDCLPLTGGSDHQQRKGIPGWTEYV